MTRKLVFDTLAYANLLEQGGVAHAAVHSAALAEALVQNLYVKDEIDKMFEAALKRFDERTTEIRNEMRQESIELRQALIEDRAKHDQEFLKIENRIEKAVNEAYERSIRRLTINLGIISTLLALVASVSHYIH